MRILVIDDDEIFLNQMEKNLILEQHSVVTTTSGNKALSILDENDFDLILMDLKMPGLSGVDLIRRIRDLGINSIIIVITGYGTIDSAVQTTRAGAYDYILKPFKFSVLSDKIKDVELEINLRRNIDVIRSVDKVQYGDFLELNNLDSHEGPFLIISDEDPNELINKFNIDSAFSLWLTHNQQEHSIAPTKLHSLKNEISNFVEQNMKGTIVLKGIETLLEVHKWEDFKRFLIYLRTELLSSEYNLILLLKERDYTEESPYQTLLHGTLSLLVNPIFNNIIEILSHPLRKDIINFLKNKEKINYNKIIKELNIQRSSSLAFHINRLVQESILNKEEHIYSLSPRGYYIAELIFLLEKLGFYDPSYQVKVFMLSKDKES